MTTNPASTNEALEEKLREAIWMIARKMQLKSNWRGTMDKYLPEVLAQLNDLLVAERIAENQMYLDRINNYKPKPGQLTAASFGSAGAGMTEMAFKHSFEDRIKYLKSKSNGGEDG